MTDNTLEAIVSVVAIGGPMLILILWLVFDHNENMARIAQGHSTDGLDDGDDEC